MKKKLLVLGAVSGLGGYLVGCLLLGGLVKEMLPIGSPQFHLHIASSLLGDIVYAIILAFACSRSGLVSAPKAFGTSLMIGFILFTGMDLLFFPLFGAPHSDLTPIPGHLFNTLIAAMLGGSAALQLSFVRDRIVRNIALEH